LGDLAEVKRIKSGDWSSYLDDSYRVAHQWQRIQEKTELELEAYLRRAGSVPSIFAMVDEEIEFSEFVCLSLTFNHRGGASQFYPTIALAKYIKNKWPEKKIILGGAYLNHIGREQLIKIFTEIDFVLYRESEESLFLLLNETETNKQLIPNMVFRDKGNIITTEQVDNVQRQLDYVPIFEGIEFDKYLSPETSVAIQYKRGCDWGKCTFCSQNNTYFLKPEVNQQGFTKRVEALKKEGVKFLFLADQMISPKDLAFINSVLGDSFFWACMMMPQKGISGQLLEEMYASGCRWICWGIESGSKGVLKSMNKPMDIEVAKANIINASQSGIKNVLLMIDGFPTETEEDRKQSLDFLKEMKPYYYDNSLSPFHVCQGSYVQNNPAEFGIEKLSRVPIYKDDEKILYSELYSYSPMKNIEVNNEDRRTIPYAEHMLIACTLYSDLAVLEL